MTTEPNASAAGKQADQKAKSTDPAADVAAARAELAATLDALQDKLNVPKRIRIASEENPIALVAAAVGVAAAIAGAVWLVVVKLRSK
ncbi:DUF3618 domain-containing protein [Humibacter ginsenosidimutans]|uniref:DUF3618 domain-containing protein n=1 Tax=Humibacter ginsenosidimutans TaxID=2599293 RepID=A0A5B8M5S2_9MICO|nr:DUF3618 domain-containing protein [Humibacter ginsenosidimutans]QDZ15606.1 DUF3618 domain-containing protein [Humibacter ginsenosidimutans]